MTYGARWFGAHGWAVILKSRESYLSVTPNRLGTHQSEARMIGARPLYRFILFVRPQPNSHAFRVLNWPRPLRILRVRPLGWSWFGPLHIEKCMLVSEFWWFPVQTYLSSKIWFCAVLSFLYTKNHLGRKKKKKKKKVKGAQLCRRSGYI